MKNSATKHTADGGDDLCDEYRFDYGKAKPNRFAGQADEPRVVVVLDPEVAEVFETPDSVNQVLRALIKTMPRPLAKIAKTRRDRTTA